MRVPSHYIKLAAATVLWGGALVAGRVIAASLPPFATAFVRFLVSSVFMVCSLRLREGRIPIPKRNLLVYLVVLSLSGVVLFNYLLFSGLQTVTAGRSSIIFAATPAMVAFMSMIFFRERLSALKVLGIAIAFTGALIAISYGDIRSLFLEPIAAGDLYILGSVVCWVIYSLAGRSAMNRCSPLALLTYVFILGTLLLFPLALWEGSLHAVAYLDAAGYISILFLSIGSAGIAYLWYYEGIYKVGPSKAAIFMNLEPIAAVTFGFLLLGETVSFTILLGGLLVITGVVITASCRRNTLTVLPD